MSLLPVDEAQARLLALADPLPAQAVPLADAAGRYLAEPLVARRDQPWTDLSAMDGYAIRFADMPGPWRLAGEVPAGAGLPSGTLAPGTTMRIFTGAPMPPGADSVVLQEDVSAQDGLIRLTGDGPGHAGKHVRPRASDFAEGAVLLPAGLRLGPPRMALAALAGHAEVPARVRPRVALLSTGDELVAPGAPCPPGKLPASNDIMLRALLEGAGAQMIASRIVPDVLPRLVEALRACADADVIVTTGGASVGDHDLVRPALEAAGGTIAFWRIAMRPGKPLIVGRLGKATVLGLPGNPISSMVTGALFLLPLVRHLAGADDPLPHPQPARLGAAMPAVGGRANYIRATLADGVVTPLAFQDSAAMQAAAAANALLIRPAGAPAAQPGEIAPVLDWATLGLTGGG
ncbi:MAG: molybdopterin molybdenumtransferase MoeA [Sphingobium sp. 66-54]|nr:MAG: molybdopterin molybdenumtransferase MoeA [Sphingobium sp. 66-54]